MNILYFSGNLATTFDASDITHRKRLARRKRRSPYRDSKSSNCVRVSLVFVFVRNIAYMQPIIQYSCKPGIMFSECFLRFKLPANANIVSPHPHTFRPILPFTLRKKPVICAAYRYTSQKRADRTENQASRIAIHSPSERDGSDIFCFFYRVELQVF